MNNNLRWITPTQDLRNITTMITQVDNFYPITIEIIENNLWYAITRITLVADNVPLSSPTNILICKTLKLKKLKILYGPVIKDNFDLLNINLDDLKKDLNLWVKKLLNYANKNKISFIEIIPPFYGFIENKTLLNIFIETFKEHNFNITFKHTVVLDTQKDIPLLWKTIDSESRRKVRKSQKQGVIIREMQTKDIPLYINIKVKHPKYYKNVEQRLKNFIENKTHFAEAWVGEYNNTPMAWQFVRYGKDVALLGGNAINPKARELKIYANDALQWHVIQRSHEKGIKWLDWVGVNPDSKDPKQKGIFKFKLRWGGSLIKYPVFTKTLHKQQLFKLYCFIKNNYHALRKLTKRGD